MKPEESILTLEIHKGNLLKSTNFEEYRDAHCSYIQMLIDGYKADLAKDAAQQNFRARWVVTPLESKDD